MNARKATTTLLSLFAGLFILLVLALMVASASGAGRKHPDRPAVGVVEIRGAIDDCRTFVEQLHAMLEDDDVRAIVIRIDSPGGAVGPSQEMRTEIRRATERKRIVASLGTVAASGGYYAALGADRIVTNPGTLTASIGVIMQHPVLPELMRTAHVDMQTYKSGALKDSGSPFRAVNAEDRDYLQGVTLEVAAQFIDAVAESRKLPREQVVAVADGRVITGARAVELGLADELGTLQDAARLALKLADVTGTPELVYPPRERRFLQELVGGAAEGATRGMVNALGQGVSVGQLWQMVLPQAQVPPVQAR